MPLIVRKYGGTSVADIGLIETIADNLCALRMAGSDLAVVVSAMGAATDHLVGLANSITDQPCLKEYDALLSTGEQVSAALLAMALHKRSCPARSFTGQQAGIRTDDSHGNALIQQIETSALRAVIDSGIIPIVAGFQGYVGENRITTLGRGGSDTTAVALAAALGADECQLCTDVDGIFTADPRIVEDATLLDEITFEEMLELASLGSKVLHARAVRLAGSHGISLRVRSTLGPLPGTVIRLSKEKPAMESPIVSGVTATRDAAKITVERVPDIPGTASAILGPLADQGINVDMIVQNVSADGRTDFTFTVPRADYRAALKAVESLVDKLDGGRVIGDDRIAKVSAVGVGMRSHSGVASKAFASLASEGINIQMISTSEIKISVVVDEKYMELALRVLHDTFHLGEGNTNQSMRKKA